MNPLIVLSARPEWAAAKDAFDIRDCESTPYGETFTTSVGDHASTFLQGGWGKISAAGSAQYAIGRWNPNIIINLGTCGGFAGRTEEGDVILADRTVVYDVMDQMNEDDSALQHYITDIDLSWLTEPYPQEVTRTALVSADRDIRSRDIPELAASYNAIAGDWESGAIAWVAARNAKRVLILRGVSDVITTEGSAAYGNLDYYETSAHRIITNLINHLPQWLNCIKQ